MNDMLECYLWASNHQPFYYWRAHQIYCKASQPRTSDRLISHWRALCLLAHDIWRCSIQPEIFTHQNFARAGIRSWSDNGRVLCAYCNCRWQLVLSQLCTPVSTCSFYYPTCHHRMHLLLISSNKMAITIAAFVIWSINLYFLSAFTVILLTRTLPISS